MAPQRSRVYGLRFGLLIFLAAVLLAPLAFLATGEGDRTAGWLVYAIIFAGMVAAWGVYAVMRRRMGGREA